MSVRQGERLKTHTCCGLAKAIDQMASVLTVWVWVSVCERVYQVL